MEHSDPGTQVASPEPDDALARAIRLLICAASDASAMPDARPAAS